MEEPTTPRSRRATWREDAVRLVEDLQRCSRGGGSAGFPAWRVGYLSGLSEVRQLPDGSHTARTHRREPHRRHGEITIPGDGRPSGALVDMLCWHLDQDVRRYELDHADPDDPWHRLPSGAMLVDPLLRTILEDAGIDELDLCRRITGADGFAAVREVATRLGPRSAVTNAVLNIRMNEVHARFTLPGAAGAEWRRGRLTVALGDMPETVAVAARGRPLRDLVDHDLIRRSAEITVTGVSRVGNESYAISTDAARAEGMMPVGPLRSTAIAA